MDGSITTYTPKKGVRFTRQRQDVFIVSLREFGNVSYAAKQAGIDRRTAYTHKENDPAFAAAWEDALDEACDGMEKEAHRRAVSGTTKQLYFDDNGNVTTEIKEYSDTLLIFLLKAHRPKKYRETIRQEHTGDGGGPVKHDHSVDLSQLTEEQLTKLLAAAEALHDPGGTGEAAPD